MLSKFTYIVINSLIMLWNKGVIPRNFEICNAKIVYCISVFCYIHRISLSFCRAVLSLIMKKYQMLMMISNL